MDPKGHEKRRKQEAITVPEMRRVLPPSKAPNARRSELPKVIREEVVVDLDRDDRLER